MTSNDILYYWGMIYYLAKYNRKNNSMDYGRQ